jgi:hypothetical protein
MTVTAVMPFSALCRCPSNHIVCRCSPITARPATMLARRPRSILPVFHSYIAPPFLCNLVPAVSPVFPISSVSPIPFDVVGVVPESSGSFNHWFQLEKPVPFEERR